MLPFGIFGEYWTAANLLFRMTTYITLLRGINVGGNKIIKMELLRDMLQEMGFINIKTYIQSGNIILQSMENNPEKIAREIKSNIYQKFGFEVPVLCIASAKYEKIILENPLLKQQHLDEAYFHLTFLSEKPQKEILESLKACLGEDEVMKYAHETLYLYCPKGYSNATLTNTFIEKKTKTTATTRNWKTCTILLEMMK